MSYALQLHMFFDTIIVKKFYGRNSMNPVSLVKEGVSKVYTFWKTPPLGKYMNFKEIVALPAAESVLSSLSPVFREFYFRQPTFL